MRIGTRGTAALLNELDLHADVLGLVVAERELVGTRAQLGEAARRLDALQSVAQATGNSKRARSLASVMTKLQAAGVTPEFDGHAREGVEGADLIPQVPESSFAHVTPAKPLHHSKVKRYERRKEWLAEDDLQEANRGFNVGRARKRRADGSQMTRKVWSAKAKKRAAQTDEVGIMRGDKIFWHDEYVSPAAAASGQFEITDARYLALTPNDEHSAWLRAGEAAGDKVRSRSRSRESAIARAKARTSLAWNARLAAAVQIAADKHRGRVRPQWVTYELVRDDLRIGRYKFRSKKHAEAHARYMVAARKAIDRLPAVVRQIDVALASVEAVERNSPVVRMRSAHEHSWKVSPKRMRRTCECGHVERKVRGRWARVEAPVKFELDEQSESRLVERLVAQGVTRESALARVARLQEVMS